MSTDPTQGFTQVIPAMGDADNFRVSAVAGFSYTNIALSAQTVVKSGAGILHGISVHTQNVSAIRLYDNTVSGGTTIATLPTSAQSGGPFYQYDLKFSTGLVVSTGSTNTDITLMYL